jgi:hypothetical protein
MIRKGVVMTVTIDPGGWVYIDAREVEKESDELRKPLLVNESLVGNAHV